MTVAALFSLSACNYAVKIPDPVATGNKEQIISEKNFTRILETTKNALATADKTLDSNALGERIGAVARVQRSAQYALKKNMGDKYHLPSLIIDSKTTPITAGTDFPRVIGNVNQPNEQQNFQTLNLWVQENARMPYALWGQTYLFPDVKIPKLKAKLTDTKTIRQAEKYVADPAKILPAYVAYLNSGENKDPKFNSGDPIYTQIKQQREQLRSALGELAGVDTISSPADFGYQMLPTEDGGAIFVGAIRYDVVVTRSKEGAILRLKGEIGALASGKADSQIDVKKKLTASYSILASFYLPPKSATDKTIQVTGATAPTLVSVTNEE